MEDTERKPPSQKKYGWWILTVIICLLVISTLRNVYYAGKDNSPKPDEYITHVPTSPIDKPLSKETGNATKPSLNDSFRLSDRYQCYSLGSCQKCTEEEMISNKICLDTGYKEPIQCSLVNSGEPLPKEPVEELPTFRSCSRVKFQGKVQFFKFLVRK
ncbi:hypothetical protein K7432_009387 [Basidiobolus ranarum]|uniref:Uncharacterized protein n=1 Tax=Basidiobolus ranarum TaxID=34480 RepID=A0ABR2WQD1_9FUNG